MRASQKYQTRDFPGGPVAKNSAYNAGETGHCLVHGNPAHAMQLLSVQHSGAHTLEPVSPHGREKPACSS